MSEDYDDDRLRWLGAGEAVARAGRIATIYREAFGHDDETAASFGRFFVEAMTSYKGASCLVGEIDGEILGFLFGFDLAPGNWWPGQIAPALTAAGHGEWLEDAFELAEIEVDPAVHGQGLGSAMLRMQLDSLRQDRALLATHPDNPSRALYTRVGFKELLADFVYPSTGEPAVIMGWKRD